MAETNPFKDLFQKTKQEQEIRHKEEKHSEDIKSKQVKTQIMINKEKAKQPAGQAATPIYQKVEAQPFAPREGYSSLGSKETNDPNAAFTPGATYNPSIRTSAPMTEQVDQIKPEDRSVIDTESSGYQEPSLNFPQLSPKLQYESKIGKQPQLMEQPQPIISPPSPQEADITNEQLPEDPIVSQTQQDSTKVVNQTSIESMMKVMDDEDKIAIKDALDREDRNKLIAVLSGALGKIGTGYYGLKTGTPTAWDPQIDKNLMEMMKDNRLNVALQNKKDRSDKIKTMVMLQKAMQGKASEQPDPMAQTYAETLFSEGGNPQKAMEAMKQKFPNQEPKGSTIDRNTKATSLWESSLYKNAMLGQGEQKMTAAQIEAEAKRRAEEERLLKEQGFKSGESEKDRQLKRDLAKQKSLQGNKQDKLLAPELENLRGGEKNHREINSILKDFDTISKSMGTYIAVKNAVLGKGKLAVNITPSHEEAKAMEADKKLKELSMRLWRVVDPNPRGLTEQDARRAHELFGGLNQDPRVLRNYLIDISGRLDSQYKADYTLYNQVGKKLGTIPQELQPTEYQKRAYKEPKAPQQEKPKMKKQINKKTGEVRYVPI